MEVRSGSDRGGAIGGKSGFGATRNRFGQPVCVRVCVSTGFPRKWEKGSKS